MSAPLALTPAADADVADARNWFEAQQTGRGDQFLVELRQQLDEIEQNPHQFGRVNPITRAAQLPISNFIVYYRITPHGVVVIAVQHTNADPQRWQQRR